MTAATSQPLSAAPAAGPLALGVIQRAIFWIALPFGILDFVLPVYGRRIGADAVQIGLFFSVFSLMTVLLRPMAGVALDRYGRRPFFLAGLAGYALAMFTFASASQVWGLLLARALQGIASACLWLAAQAITADVAGAESRGSAFGSVTQASSQGGILGTFIGFTVLFSLNLQAGWQILFTGYAAVSLFALFKAWRDLKETNPPAPLAAHPTPIPRSRPWLLLLLVTIVTAASWSMISPVLMIFLQDRLSVEVTDLAKAFLPAALVWAWLPSRLGHLADRFGRKPLMVLGLAAASVTSFLIPGLASLAALAILWALQALCYAAGDPAEQALVADLTGGDQRGRAYGLYAMAGGLGAAIGPLLGGWLYQNVGASAPFIANGAVLALCALTLAALLQLPAPHSLR